MVFWHHFSYEYYIYQIKVILQSQVIIFLTWKSGWIITVFLGWCGKEEVVVVGCTEQVWGDHEFLELFCLFFGQSYKLKSRVRCQT